MPLLLRRFCQTCRSRALAPFSPFHDTRPCAAKTAQCLVHDARFSQPRSCAVSAAQDDEASSRRSPARDVIREPLHQWRAGVSPAGHPGVSPVPPGRRRECARERIWTEGCESPPVKRSLTEAERNCVVATRGGEQREANDRSVRGGTRFGLQRWRACFRKVKPKT